MKRCRPRDSDDAKYREAHQEEIKAYRQAHREEASAAAAKYYLEHKEAKAEYYQAHRATIAEYRLEHQEEMKARNAKYRQEHVGVIKAYAAIYNQEHLEERKAYAAKWYISRLACNAKEIRAAQAQHNRAYAAANPLKRREIDAKRNALKKGATVEPVDYAFVKKRDKMVCGLCHKKVKQPELQFDHIVPLSRGGAHATWQVQVAHATCNARKGNTGKLPSQTRLPDGNRTRDLPRKRRLWGWLWPTR